MRPNFRFPKKNRSSRKWNYPQISEKSNPIKLASIFSAIEAKWATVNHCRVNSKGKKIRNELAFTTRSRVNNWRHLLDESIKNFRDTKNVPIIEEFWQTKRNGQESNFSSKRGTIQVEYPQPLLLSSKNWMEFHRKWSDGNRDIEISKLNWIYKSKRH